MVSGADNLGKGINRIWGRTHRHFHPTCGTRGEERTSSSLLRARAWGHFRDFCLNFSALRPYTSCRQWMEVIEVVSIDSLSLRGAGIRRGLGLGCGPMEVVEEVVLIDSSLLRRVGTGRGLALGHCLVDGPGLDTDLDRAGMRVWWFAIRCAPDSIK